MTTQRGNNASDQTDESSVPLNIKKSIFPPNIYMLADRDVYENKLYTYVQKK